MSNINILVAPTCATACTNGNICTGTDTCTCGGQTGCTGNDMCANNKCGRWLYDINSSDYLVDSLNHFSTLATKKGRTSQRLLGRVEIRFAVVLGWAKCGARARSTTTPCSSTSRSTRGGGRSIVGIFGLF